MGKKGGKSDGAVSAGIHSNVSRSIKNEMRKEYRASADRLINQLKAQKRGKNVVYTIANPNPSETNKPFVRVNARDLKNKAR